MAENRRERDKRFYFSRGQMILLGGTFTIASAVIFLLGMFVGKSIEARRMVKAEEPLIKLPVKPPGQNAASVSGQTKDDLPVFESDSRAAAAQPPSNAPPREIKSADSTIAPEPKPIKATKELQSKPTEKNSEKAAPPEPAKKTALEPAQSKDEAKAWRVQVNAYPDEPSAKQLVDRLKNKGYNAYVSEARNKGKVWYRVSVGKYGSREEADKMLENIKTKENFAKAFATAR